MAEAMEVDMSFSDVTCMDISMADADISRLLNGTRVINLQTPQKPHVKVDDDVYISGDILPAADSTFIAVNANSTFSCDNQNLTLEANKTMNNSNSLNTTYEDKTFDNATSNSTFETVKNVTIERNPNTTFDIGMVKNDLNATFGADDNVPDTNGIPANTTVVIEERNANNVTEVIDSTINKGQANTSELPEEEIFEDALPPEEEIRQVLDGSRVSLTRHAVEIKLDDQQPDLLIDQEDICSAGQTPLATMCLQVEEEAGSSGHSSGNYQDAPEIASELSKVDLIVSGAMEPESPTQTTTVYLKTPEPVEEPRNPINTTLEKVDIEKTVESSTNENPDTNGTIIVDPATKSETLLCEVSKSSEDVRKIPPQSLNTSLLASTLSACQEVANKSINLMESYVTDGVADSSNLLLDHSLAGFNVGCGSAAKVPAVKKNLLDCSLDPFTSMNMQQVLVQQHDKVLQSVNRMDLEKVPAAKETNSVSFFDRSIGNVAENKENIKNATTAGDRSELGRRPRTSVLLQFDPLPNFSTVSEEAPKPADQTRTLSKTRSAGRLVDLPLETDVEYRRAMDAFNEEKMNLIQEVNRLKLENNQVKQENTSLTLEIQKKEEVCLKTEANCQLKEEQYRTELKQLVEQLATVKEHNNNEELSEVKKALKESQLNVKKLMEENAHYKKIMNEYEATLSAGNCENEKLKTEHQTVTQHLATLEVSFSDIISKYDRCKEIISGFVRNEETLKDRLEKSNQIALKYEERYETLKSHANSQLDKANKDLIAAKDTHRGENAKLNTMIKRLEIKNESLQQTLEQKTAECTALASLCDEMTGSGIR